MKGKTKCPKCKHEFIVDVPEGVERYNVTCPECGYSFVIIPGGAKPGQWRWEEHGGPRKTILPPLNFTKRPALASLLLFIVSILGVVTAVIVGSNPYLLNGFTPFGYYVSGIFGSYSFVWLILILIFSGFAMIGGFACYQKRPLLLAMLGSVCGIFSFGLIIVGPILSIVALLLIFSSKNEFENGLYGKEF